MTPRRRISDFEGRLHSAISGMKLRLGAKDHEDLVLGLVFLRSLCRSFELRQEELEREANNPRSELYRKSPASRRALVEDRRLYGDPIFWIPPVSRWPVIASAAHGPGPGRAVDIAMAGIEQANPDLTGIFPLDYARPTLNKAALARLIDVLNEFPAAHDNGASVRSFERVRKAVFGDGARLPRPTPRRPVPALDPRTAHLIERLDAELEEARRLATEFRRGPR